MFNTKKNKRISNLERVTNEEALERAGVMKTVMNNIRKRQTKFFGYVLRRQGMEGPVTRKTDRKREKIQDNLAIWLHRDTPRETMICVWDRDGWGSVWSSTTIGLPHGDEPFDRR